MSNIFIPPEQEETPKEEMKKIFSLFFEKYDKLKIFLADDYSTTIYSYDRDDMIFYNQGFLVRRHFFFYSGIIRIKGE